MLTHQVAVKVAQEADNAVAHSCLAFMELHAGGWGQSSAIPRPR